MAGPTNRESDKFIVRLPDGMRDRIKAAAEANNRSMNAEIIHRLEQSFPKASYDPCMGSGGFLQAALGHLKSEEAEHEDGTSIPTKEEQEAMRAIYHVIRQLQQGGFRQD